MSPIRLSSDLPVLLPIRDDAVVAATWGVFPGKEIVQPTIVDQASFLVRHHPFHGDVHEAVPCCCSPLHTTLKLYV